MMVTIRVRAIVWFATGAVVALIASLVVLQAWRADAAPGDSDTTLVQITPCRLVDTRPQPFRVGPHGTLSVADTTTMKARGANGECVIPNKAVGLAMNVTALNATTESFLTFWPSGALPLAANLNPAPGQPPNPNSVNVSLAAAGTFKVYNNAGTVDVVIDVNGYYIKRSLRQLDQRLTALEKSQPFAVTAFVGASANLTNSPMTYVTASLQAPVDGQVTVNTTAHVAHNLDGGNVFCLISTSTSVPDSFVSNLESYHAFERGGLSNSGSLSATRTFDIAVGTTVTYVLACGEGADGGRIYARNITAIFTPAP